MKRLRFCRRGHELILGKTAYAAERWGGNMLFGSADGYIVACQGNAQYACKYGNVEAHQRLEGKPVSGGTRIVGTTEEDGRTIWQHRVFELRCRECNRRRVAAHRAKTRERR